MQRELRRKPRRGVLGAVVDDEPRDGQPRLHRERAGQARQVLLFVPDRGDDGVVHVTH